MVPPAQAVSLLPTDYRQQAIKFKIVGSIKALARNGLPATLGAAFDITARVVVTPESHKAVMATALAFIGQTVMDTSIGEFHT